MSTKEYDRRRDRLGTETNVHLAAVVANRVLPELFGRGEEEVFDRLEALPDDVLEQAVGGPVRRSWTVPAWR